MDPARSDRRPFVLDTSVFVNPESRRPFGGTTPEALARFLRGTRELGIECCMPPSVFRELHGFLAPGAVPRDLLGELVQKGPSLDITLSAQILLSWVTEMRARVNRGLRVAEKAVKAASAGEAPDVAVRRLRNEFRRSLREGLVDSRQDLELALLAKELDGVLVTVDGGLRDFAEKLGVRMLDPEQAAARLGIAPPEGGGS